MARQRILGRKKLSVKVCANMREEQEVGRAIEQYADTVRRLCMIHLRHHADAEDVFQTVFLKYALHSEPFESEEHEKAWIIRVTINACRDLGRSFFRSCTVSLDEMLDQPDEISRENKEVLEAVRSLAPKYRNMIYMHYYEGYTAPQIGRILGKKVNTVYTLLARGRQQLKERLEGDVYGE